MSGIKGKGGQPGRSGRRPGGNGKHGPLPKRYPAFCDGLGVEFSEPTTRHVLEIELGHCDACGCVWWSDYEVIVRQAEQAEPDVNGESFPVLTKVKRQGQPERHRKGCPMAN